MNSRPIYFKRYESTRRACISVLLFFLACPHVPNHARQEYSTEYNSKVINLLTILPGTTLSPCFIVSLSKGLKPWANPYLPTTATLLSYFSSKTYTKPMSADAPSQQIDILSIHVNNVRHPCRRRHAAQGMYTLFSYSAPGLKISTYRSPQPYIPPHSKSTTTPACTRTTKQCKVASPKKLISACSSRPRRSNQRCSPRDTGWCMLC